MNTIKSSYTLHGIRKSRNFARTVENGEEFSHQYHIGYMDSSFFSHSWQLYLKRIGNCYYPVIGVPHVEFDCINVKISFFFNIITRNRELKDKYKTRQNQIVDMSVGAVGEPMDLHELLDPEKGWLDKNGALVVQYGARVEGIQRPGCPWEFNLDYPVFGDHTAVVRTRYRARGNWAPEPDTIRYAHAQMLAFHSTKFRKGQDFIVQESGCMLLHVLHGVYQDFYGYFSSDEFQAARESGMDSLILLMQQKVGKERDWKDADVQLACEMGLRNLLSQVLRRFESEEELKTFLKSLEPEKMAGESMKMMVAKVLYGKF